MASETRSRLAVVSWLAVAGYWILLTYLLLTPDPFWFLHSTGRALDVSLERNVADYVQHGGAFLVLSWLLAFARRTTGRPSVRWLVAASGVYSIATELLQHFVPLRFTDWTDAAANFGGIVLGWISVELLLTFVPRLNPAVSR